MNAYTMLCLALSVSALVQAEVLESRRGDFRIETHRASVESKSGREATMWTASVLTRSGDKLYTLTKEVPYGSPYPGVQVSDHAGETVVVDAFGGFVEFYDPAGALLRRWRPFGEAEPDHERTLKCAAADDRLAFLISSASTDGARVVMCSSGGEEFWSGKLSHASGSEIYLSPDGRTVIASTYAVADGVTGVATDILDDRAARIQTLPLLMRNADVDSLGRRFVVTDRNELVFGILRPSDEQHSRVSGAEGSVITGAVCIGESVGFVMERLVAGGDGVRYEDPTFVMIANNGRELFRNVLNGRSKTQARFSLQRGEIRVWNAQNWKLIKLSDDK